MLTELPDSALESAADEDAWVLRDFLADRVARRQTEGRPMDERALRKEAGKWLKRRPAQIKEWVLKEKPTYYWDDHAGELMAMLPDYTVYRAEDLGVCHVSFRNFRRPRPGWVDVALQERQQ